MRLLWLVGLGLCLLPFAGHAASKKEAVISLRAGASQLAFLPNSSGQYGLRVIADPTVFLQDRPVAIEVIDSMGTAAWLTGGYSGVAPHGGILVAEGRIQTRHGTVFRVTDTYAPLPGISAFTLTRHVKIEAASPEDTGFSSRFSLEPAVPTALSDCEFFVPGIWYKKNASVPPTALASHPADHFFFFREDRLPLPVVMQRDTRTGGTFLLAHLDGNPATFAGEDGLKRLTDARLQFGALGIQNMDRPTPTFLFPGTEGERTYTFGGSLQGNRWAYRSHPVRVGVPHQYRLLFGVRRTADFPTALRQTWRAAYALQNPPLVPVDLDKVYQEGIALLGTYCRRYSGVPSIPFAVTVPSGVVKDTSSQMGFVGQALPAAALLIAGSQARADTDAALRASEIINFWTKNSLTPSGLPKTWYDIHSDGSFTWRSYPTFLRVASDGMEGALQARNSERRHGRDRPDWLAFCRRYGDWLVGAQNRDGSWFREYGFDGKLSEHPNDVRVRDPRAKDTTDHAIPFLVDLYLATGDTRYRKAALRAGEFCLETVHLPYAYVGGTPDNPNVLDKEGGMMALDAFLALHDMTSDKRWLGAANQAAEYSETWVYAWNIPMPPDDPEIVFPKGRRTEGLSLIATGHSGADTYMAAAPFFFYRLSLLTGETHFRDVARLLLYDTNQLLDWDGILGYAHPGLQTEALSLPPLRGHGTTVWLPWLTVAQLLPLARLRDTFGTFDIHEIEKMPLAERLRRERRWAVNRGFF